jgi:hypothetical protein
MFIRDELMSWKLEANAIQEDSETGTNSRGQTESGLLRNGALRDAVLKTIEGIKYRAMIMSCKMEREKVSDD